ncbi:MAG: acetyl-CoA hydrolase [Burkholderiales bacterium]|nr:acetyl-CoA hydrolase [Burkholderiales bacterium]
MKQLTELLAPGQRVFVSTMSGESALLAEELAADPERAREVTFCGGMFPGIDRTDYLTLHPAARVEAFFMSPGLRRGIAEGRAHLLALDYRGLARHLLEGPPPHLAIAQLTPPDADGWCSAGLAADFMPLAWPRARRRVAHLNPCLPRTAGSFRVHASEIDLAIEAARAPLSWNEPTGGDTESRIGARVAELVRDGDTLQFGIGSVPVALAGALASHRRLRIHGGMVSGSLRTLWEAGALDRDARITSGVVLGDAALHAFVGGLPTLWLTDVRHTHDPAAIGAIPRFVAINSAVEVDLFGQVNAERAGGVLQAGAGGLPAFAQGALASPGGRLLICLPATARGGGVSRIVAALGAQSLCTVPRHLADAVITEFGVAELRGLDVEGRAQALIAVAAPDHRSALAQAWQAMRRSL